MASINNDNSNSNSNSLAPPLLSVNTRVRKDSGASTLGVSPSGVSTTSNPFLTPAGSEDPFLTPNNRSRATSVTTNVVDREEALRPDPGTEGDFRVDDNPFAFSPGQLNKLLNPKSLAAYRALGGIKGIARGLQTDLDAGLSIDETSVRRRITFQEAVDGTEAKAESSPPPGREPFSDRTRVYGRNVLPAKKATPLWRLMWNAYNDKVLILLTVAAVISLALGLYETLGVDHPEGAPPAVDWIEGVAICAAIIIVVGVGSINDWQKEKAFVRLNEKKEDREIKVIRSGKAVIINVHDLLVGDVVNLEPGDLIPVDGIFIGGHDLKCDESSATGESDALKKTGGEQVFRMLESGERAKSADLDPFIISGAKVLEGMGTFVCTSVGPYSSFGKIMMSVRTEVEATPLQRKLEGLAGAIAKLGGGAALLLFIVLLIRFLANLPNDTRDGPTKASTFMVSLHSPDIPHTPPSS
jgi:P-type Ca2+ transporter type 2C